MHNIALIPPLISPTYSFSPLALVGVAMEGSSSPPWVPPSCHASLQHGHHHYPHHPQPLHILCCFTLHITLSLRILLARQLEHPPPVSFREWLLTLPLCLCSSPMLKLAQDYFRRQSNGTLYTVHRNAFLKQWPSHHFFPLKMWDFPCLKVYIINFFTYAHEFLSS